MKTTSSLHELKKVLRNLVPALGETLRVLLSQAKSLFLCNWLRVIELERLK